MSPDTERSTRFLNVDLDIYSKSNLEPLVAALGRRVLVLYVGRLRRTYKAVLEIAGNVKTADAAIKQLAALIRTLPKTERKLWDTAKRRDFNVGLQAGKQPFALELSLEPETVQAAASLNARIVITVYAPEQQP